VESGTESPERRSDPVARPPGHLARTCRSNDSNAGVLITRSFRPLTRCRIVQPKRHHSSGDPNGPEPMPTATEISLVATPSRRMHAGSAVQHVGTRPFQFPTVSCQGTCSYFVGFALSLVRPLPATSQPGIDSGESGAFPTLWSSSTTPRQPGLLAHSLDLGSTGEGRPIQSRPLGR